MDVKKYNKVMGYVAVGLTGMLIGVLLNVREHILQSRVEITTKRYKIDLDNDGNPDLRLFINKSGKLSFEYLEKPTKIKKKF